MKTKSNKFLYKIGFAIILAVLCAYMIIPIYIIIKVSFGTTEEIMTQHPTLLPHKITLEHWADVLTSGKCHCASGKELYRSYGYHHCIHRNRIPCGLCHFPAKPQDKAGIRNDSVLYENVSHCGNCPAHICQLSEMESDGH